MEVADPTTALRAFLLLLLCMAKTKGAPRMEKLQMPEVTNQGYRRSKYDIECSLRLAIYGGSVFTNVTRNHAREIAKVTGHRLSTAAEEYELSEKGYEHAAFNDVFAIFPSTK